MGLFSRKKIETQTPKTTDFAAVREEALPSEILLGSEREPMIEEFDINHRTHFRPNSYDDTGEIADTLIRFHEVTVSFKDIADKNERRRVIDFLTGVMYALDGTYKKVDNGIYHFWISQHESM